MAHFYFDKGIPLDKRYDASRIKQAFEREGHSISLTDAFLAWDAHSEDWCASWLALPTEASTSAYADDADEVLTPDQQIVLHASRHLTRQG